MTDTSAQKKGLWGMSRPLLVEQALQLSVPVLDTFFLSRVSDSAAAAAGAMTPVIYFCVNILWVTIFAGSSVAGQRLGAGNNERTLATIATYSFWGIILGTLLTFALFYLSPFLTQLMGLPDPVRANANLYMSIICLMGIVWAAKLIFQSVLNIYGQPQWNMYANILFFVSNVLGNSIVVFGLFGFPKLGIVGVAWASVGASLLALIFSAVVIFLHIKLKFQWVAIHSEFKKASQHLLRIAAPSMIEPLSFDLNMIVLNSFAAGLGTLALAAKVYTFNTFLLGLIVTIAIGTATQVLISQYVGANNYARAALQMRQSLKAALWAAGIVGTSLVLLSHPVMRVYTDNELLISASIWLFLLAALTEPTRAVNIIVGQSLRATGDGFLISVIGPLFTWFVAIPLAYIFAFIFGWGIYGILLSAVVDEACRAIMYWKRWQSERWHHTHVHAREQRSSAKN